MESVVESDLDGFDGFFSRQISLFLFDDLSGYSKLLNVVAVQFRHVKNIVPINPDLVVFIGSSGETSGSDSVLADLILLVITFKQIVRIQNRGVKFGWIGPFFDNIDTIRESTNGNQFISDCICIDGPEEFLFHSKDSHGQEFGKELLFIFLGSLLESSHI